MKLQMIFVALALALMGFASPSFAQRGGKGVSMDGDSPLTVRSNGSGTAGENYADFVYGVVKVLNNDEIVLTKTNAGVDETYKLNKKTKFTHDGKRSSLESVKLGDKVWVDAAQDKKTGTLTARRVVSGAFLM